MKGMLVYIFKSSMGDCTNGGVTSEAKRALLVGNIVPQIFDESDDYPTLVLKPHAGIWIAQPPIAPKGVGWMFGGNFIYTSDSRFNAINKYPIPVHDRTESQAQYDALSR